MQSADFKWFKDNMEALYEQYGPSFLAIKDKKVLGAYGTYAEGVRKTQETEELGTFIVQECGVDETAYTGCIASMNFAAVGV